ncbi:MAG: hypothetical protein CME02_06775 [Geminicoccus sp.]|nr:hypothetical protein [Geminicoccus sp.]
MKTVKTLSGFAAASAVALILAACGSDDHQLCIDANWYKTGVHRAQQGLENRYTQLADICTAIGWIPNANVYDRGYQDGPTLPRLIF